MTSLRALLEQAGFHGHALDMAVAVSMAESRGHANAHNTNVNTGDNSYGLFQINMLGSLGPARRAQYGLSSNNQLFDPLTNAKVAFRMSDGGRDWTPWSTYKSGAYQHFLGPSFDTQISGVGMADIPPPIGGTDGTDGAASGTAFDIAPGHSLTSADSIAEQHAEQIAYSLGYLGRPEPMGTSVTGGQQPGNPDALHTFLTKAAEQLGDRYVFGAKGTGQADPTAFDCSGLTAWAADQAGVHLPAGAAHQYVWLKQHGDLIPVSQAIHTPGALLFHFASEPQPGDGEPEIAHVAISRGDGKTIEAADPQDGVVSWDAGGGRFNYAAIIPGIGDLPPTGGGAAADALLGDHMAGGGDPLSSGTDPLDASAPDVWQTLYDKLGAYQGSGMTGTGPTQPGPHGHDPLGGDHGHHGGIDVGH